MTKINFGQKRKSAGVSCASMVIADRKLNLANIKLFQKKVLCWSKF